jgi:hypothetical protein
VSGGRSALLVLPAIPALAILLWWTAVDGGYDRLKWMPGSVVLVALAGLSLALGGGTVLRRSRAALIATAGLTLYTVWSFVSIWWAGAPGPAFEGSLRTLTFLAAWILFASLPWTVPRLEALVTAFVLGVGAIGVITVLRVAAAADPRLHMIDARLAEPLTYQNANAALWAMAAFPALLLASRRATAAIARPPLLATATLCLGLGALAQSRGWLFGLPVIVAVMLLATPGRVRVLLAAIPVCAGVALALPALLEVYEVGGGRVPSEAVADVRVAFDAAARTLLTVTAGVLVVGVLIALADRRVSIPATVARRGSRAVGGLAVVAAVAAGIVVVHATNGDPAGTARDAWAGFKDFEGSGDGDASGSRFTELGSSRYDFWRVSVDLWQDNVLTGTGQDNFAQAYLRERRSSFEEPRWTHSLELRLLVHTGLIGLLLFGAWIVAALWAVVARPRTPRGAEQRRIAILAAMPLIVWLVHGSVDWLWEYPALSGAAIGLAGAAAVVGRSSTGRPLRKPAAAAVGAIALLAALAYLPPYFAERHIKQAARGWAYDPAWAYDQLDRSQALNGLSSQAWLIEGTIALQLEDYRHARMALREAADREPQDWFAHFQLGQLATLQGDRRAARAAYAEALERNPRDAFIRDALRRLDSGQPVRPPDAATEFGSRVDRRLGRG